MNTGGIDRIRPLGAPGVAPAQPPATGPVSQGFQVEASRAPSAASASRSNPATDALRVRIQEGIQQGASREQALAGLVQGELDGLFGGHTPRSITAGVTDALASDPTLRQLVQRLLAAAGGSAAGPKRT